MPYPATIGIGGISVDKDGAHCQTPGRLWSLRDIMNQFNVAALVTTMSTLHGISSMLKTIALRNDQAGGSKLPDLVKSVSSILKSALEQCKEAEFTEAVQQIEITELRLDSALGIDASRLDAEIEHVFAAVVTELCNRKFLFIQKDRSEYLDQEALFGLAVFDAFPSARFDIREAGNCLAAECPTAAVFHLMRAVEWGLRALCAHLGFTRVKRRRKSGKVSYVQIEYSEWEVMINQLQKRVSDRLDRIKRGKDKHVLQVFYNPVLQDIRAIRDAWRNHVMHTRAEYTPKDAEAILDHVQRLMVKLSERVSEC